MTDTTLKIPDRLAADIIDKSSEGFLVINDNHELVYANPAWIRMHGYEPEDSIPHDKALEILFPDPQKRRESIEMWNHDINLENPPSREAQRHTKDGGKSWFRFQLIHLDKGYKMVKVQDINECKLLELQYKAIFEKAPDAIVLIDAETTRIIQFNEKAIQVLGYTHQDYTNLRVEDIATGSKTRTNQHIANALEHGYEGFEASARSKNGEIRDFYVSLTSIEVAERKILQSIMHDITDRKKAEVALAESEEMFRNLAEQSPNMIFINQQQRVVYANNLCETIMGYSRKEFYSPNFNYMCLIAPEYHSLTEKAWKKHTAGKEAPSYEYEILAKDGRRISAYISTKLIRYRGNPAVLGTITDISALKHVEKELSNNSTILREQKKALQQKNTALKEILAQIETEKLQLKQQVSANVKMLLLPALKKMRIRAQSVDKRYIDLLESNIKQLASNFGIELTSGPSNLSPREVEICNMIKGGLSSKEIADLLHVSIRTVDTHRNRIRKKLRITARDINLTTHLKNLA